MNTMHTDIAILAIDPGTERSALVMYRPAVRAIQHHITIENNGLVHQLRAWQTEDAVLAVEMIASYGMPVGREVFETCVWLGRFVQAWWPGTHRFVYRKDVKLHLCGNVRAKDAHVRQALIDLLGAPGTKKAPGPTYGIHGDEWAALAIAVTAADTMTAMTAVQGAA